MRGTMWATLGLLATAALVAAAEPQAWKLTMDSVGKLPAGWVAGKTGMGEGSV